MSDIVISVENLTKEYRIGTISHRTLQRDIQSWWARVRGKEDPNLPLEGGRRKKHEAMADENGVIHALKDVSFEVKQGEVLGIIGKNGAGKSTLLKILSRVTAPTSGCVKIKGRIGSLLEVGTGFHPELTGRENIYMNGAILGMKKREIDRKLDEIIDFSGVEQFIDTPVKRYSSGMYVRLAFAVAAHLDPEILVIDEVLAVGDAEFQKKCLGKMDDVSKKEGRTVLFVSHNMAIIEQLCGRGFALRNGMIFFKGPVRECIQSLAKDICLATESIPIVKRKDRQGDGRARVKEIRILNQDHKETSKIGMGETFHVILSISGRLKNAIVAIMIGDYYRPQMLRAYTHENIRESFDLDFDSNEVLCTFHELPLMHGRYFISTWLGTQRGLSDYLEAAASLDIEPRDVYGSGKKPDPLGGVSFCRASWMINKKEDG